MTSEKPKDIGLKIGTKREVIWTDVKKQTEILIENSEKTLQVNKEILKLAEIIIAEEKKSLNRS